VLADNSEVPEVLVAGAGRHIRHRVERAMNANLLAHDILRRRIDSPGLGLVDKIRCMGKGRRDGRKHQCGSEDNFAGDFHSLTPFG
jgi:hypothetical protein